MDTLDVMMHIKVSLLLQQQVWVNPGQLTLPDAPSPIRLDDVDCGYCDAGRLGDRNSIKIRVLLVCWCWIGGHHEQLRRSSLTWALVRR